MRDVLKHDGNTLEKYHYHCYFLHLQRFRENQNDLHWPYKSRRQSTCITDRSSYAKQYSQYDECSTERNHTGIAAGTKRNMSDYITEILTNVSKRPRVS